MRRESPLPSQWKVLEGKVRYVVQVSETEFCCSCPACGGDVHEDGSFPDRCRLFVDSHPRLFCRRCGLVSFPDKFGGQSFSKPSTEEIERWRQEQIVREEARKRSAERALQNLRNSACWERYYQQRENSPEARQRWEQRGIPEAYQSFWELGWDKQHEFYLGNNYFSSATLTIPILDPRREVLNIKHRILNPPEGCPKYLPEIGGQGQLLFRTDPDANLDGEVIVIEGEIKSMVTFARIDDGSMKIIGIPGDTPGEGITKQLLQAERIIVVLDPGSEEKARRLCSKLGSQRTRYLIPPVKIDDGILEADFRKSDIVKLLRKAVPI
jgi:hypothetical protein